MIATVLINLNISKFNTTVLKLLRTKTLDLADFIQRTQRRCRKVPHLKDEELYRTEKVK